MNDEETAAEAIRTEEEERRLGTLERMNREAEVSRNTIIVLFGQIRTSVLATNYGTTALRETAINNYNLQVRAASVESEELFIESGELPAGLVAKNLIEFTEAIPGADLEAEGRREGEEGSIGGSRDGGSVFILPPKNRATGITESAINAHNSVRADSYVGGFTEGQQLALEETKDEDLKRKMRHEFYDINESNGVAVSNQDKSIYGGSKSGQAPFLAVKAGTVIGDGDSEGRRSIYHEITSKLAPVAVAPVVRRKEFRAPKGRPLIFDGTEIGAFIDLYGSVFAEAEDSVKFSSLVQYVSESSDRKKIESIQEFKEKKDWKKFLVALKRYYVDSEKGKYTITNLENYCRETAITKIETVNDLITFTGNFTFVSSILTERGLLNKVSEARIYLSALHPSLQKTLLSSRIQRFQVLKNLPENEGLEVEQILAKIPVEDIREEVETILALTEADGSMSRSRKVKRFVYQGEKDEEDSEDGSRSKGVVEKLFSKSSESTIESIREDHNNEMKRRDAKERSMREELDNLSLKVNAFGNNSANPNFNVFNPNYSNGNQQNGYNNNNFDSNNNNDKNSNNNSNYQGKNYDPNFNTRLFAESINEGVGGAPRFFYDGVYGHVIGECRALGEDIESGLVRKGNYGTALYVNGERLVRSNPNGPWLREIAREMKRKSSEGGVEEITTPRKELLNA